MGLIWIMSLLTAENKSTRIHFNETKLHNTDTIMNNLLHPFITPTVRSDFITDHRPKVWEWRAWCIRLACALPLKVRAQIWSSVVPCPPDSSHWHLHIARLCTLHTSSSKKKKHTHTRDYRFQLLNPPYWPQKDPISSNQCAWYRTLDFPMQKHPSVHYLRTWIVNTDAAVHW